MSRQPIRTDQAPRSPLYSQGVRVNDHIYVSGMTGTDPATGALAGKTIQETDRPSHRQLRGRSWKPAARDTTTSWRSASSWPTRPTSPASTRRTPACFSHRSAHTLRGETRRRAPRGPRLDPDDRRHLLSPLRRNTERILTPRPVLGWVMEFEPPLAVPDYAARYLRQLVGAAGLDPGPLGYGAPVRPPDLRVSWRHPKAEATRRESPSHVSWRP